MHINASKCRLACLSRLRWTEADYMATLSQLWSRKGAQFIGILPLVGINWTVSIDQSTARPLTTASIATPCRCLHFICVMVKHCLFIMSLSPNLRNILYVTMVLSSSNAPKTRFRLGFRAPEPTGGAYDAPRPPISWGGWHPRAQIENSNFMNFKNRKNSLILKQPRTFTFLYFLTFLSPIYQLSELYYSSSQRLLTSTQCTLSRIFVVVLGVRTAHSSHCTVFLCSRWQKCYPGLNVHKQSLRQSISLLAIDWKRSFSTVHTAPNNTT